MLSYRKVVKAKIGNEGSWSLVTEKWSSVKSVTIGNSFLNLFVFFVVYIFPFTPYALTSFSPTPQLSTYILMSPMLLQVKWCTYNLNSPSTYILMNPIFISRRGAMQPYSYSPAQREARNSAKGRIRMPSTSRLRGSRQTHR